MKARARKYNDGKYAGPSSFCINPNGTASRIMVSPKVRDMLSAGLMNKSKPRATEAARLVIDRPCPSCNKSGPHELLDNLESKCFGCGFSWL